MTLITRWTCQHTHAAMDAGTAWLFVPLLPQDDSAVIAIAMVFCVIGASVPALGCGGWMGTVAALSLGYVSHLTGDACTRGGIQLLYPYRKSYYLLPRKLRVVTGSQIEELLFIAFALLFIALLLSRLTM